MKARMWLAVVLMLAGATGFAMAQGQEKAGGGGGGKWGERPREGAGAEGVNMGHLMMLVHTAATQPWAVSDAQTQQALDKVLADRKTALQTESDQLAAYQKLVQANRAGDKDGAAAAQKSLEANRATMQELHKTLAQDLKDLAERVKTIRPAGEGAGHGGHGKGGKAAQQGNAPAAQ